MKYFWSDKVQKSRAKEFVFWYSCHLVELSQKRYLSIPVL